jgi:transcriptional regulator with XRE-family HTH domain
MDKFYTIGAAIRAFRERNGMSQEELGRRIKKTRQTIIKIEDDPDDTISVNLLRKIAKVFDVSILELLPEYRGEKQLDPSYDSIVRSLLKLFGKNERYYRSLSDSDKELTRILGLVAIEYIRQQEDIRSVLTLCIDKEEITPEND